MNTIAIAPEIDGLKARLKETWMAATMTASRAIWSRTRGVFYEHLDVPPGCQLLDVACGSGQLALLAARDGANVTGVDIAPQPGAARPGTRKS